MITVPGPIEPTIVNGSTFSVVVSSVPFGIPERTTVTAINGYGAGQAATCNQTMFPTQFTCSRTMSHKPTVASSPSFSRSVLASPTPVPLPGPVTSLTASIAGLAQRVKLAWLPPEGSAVSYYTISWVVTGKPGSTYSKNASQLTTTVDGLLGATQYRFWIAAVDSAGAGPACTVAVVVNSNLPIPLPPVLVTATPGDSVASVTWTVVQRAATMNYTLFSQISSCTLTCSSCVDPAAVVCNVAWTVQLEANSKMSCNVTGLSDGVVYIFRAACCNDAGMSPLSVPSRAIIPFSGTMTTPGSPLKLRVTSVARYAPNQQPFEFQLTA